MTSSHILTMVQNLIAGHTSCYEKPQWTGPAQQRAELISLLISPADMSRHVVVMVAVTGGPAILRYINKIFFSAEGLV
jgi:hypothetical protein